MGTEEDGQSNDNRKRNDATEKSKKGNTKRGTTIMIELNKKWDGNKIRVAYDEKGRPNNRVVRRKLAGMEGALARSKVPLSEFETWHDLPEPLRDDLWEAMQGPPLKMHLKLSPRLPSVEIFLLTSMTRFPRIFLSDIFSKERLFEDSSSISHLYNDGTGLSINIGHSFGCFAKGFYTINIDVSLNLAYGVGESSTSGDNSSNSYGSSSCAYGSGTGSEIVPIKELRSRLWAFNLKRVGQIFVDVNDFRLKVLQYSIETGYKYQFSNNDPERVTVYCAKKESTGCLWRVHAVYEFDSFVIKTMHFEHFCGFVYKDVNSCLMLSKKILF
ncbi:hypothetical protein IFM89_014908 [Coptis chinensis]|uniref:Transposase MuDR plant domain-containing protein n=1 Tax=Coptis chinensis TaxID=261450 RepID=A0A835LED0_9MAGN|nr:hypothetical protein IFM89_014908 [Coptis chinensis]